MDQNELFHKD